MLKTDWFTESRFGMFIHWGLYAIPGRGEWVRSMEKICNEDYQPYFDNFNPVDYDPVKWARAARAAGMKYAVMTAKHHDGFCLFDSKLTDYKSTNTKCGRDLIREYADAFRAEGLKVGFYYSLLDWHHPDYPHFGDWYHPMRDNEKFKGAEHNFENYLDYMHGQVRELVTGYGELDLLWFDFSYGELSGEKWRATELVRMIRKYQPGVLIDNRLEGNGEAGFGSLMSGAPTECSGDFVCPEQIIPPEGMRDVNGKPVVWEACFTMNNHWGYHADDAAFKPADMIVKKLIECVSKGGNMLVNVGPDAKGNIPPQSLEILAKVGEWVKLNGESVYGCGYSPIAKPEYGRITAKGEKVLYYHIMEAPIGWVALTGLKREQVKRVWFAATGAEIKISTGWGVDNYPNFVFISLSQNPYLPDATDTVVGVELE